MLVSAANRINQFGCHSRESGNQIFILNAGFRARAAGLFSLLVQRK
jgi:hypothetical protein